MSNTLISTFAQHFRGVQACLGLVFLHTHIPLFIYKTKGTKPKGSPPLPPPKKHISPLPPRSLGPSRILHTRLALQNKTHPVLLRSFLFTWSFVIFGQFCASAMPSPTYALMFAILPIILWQQCAGFMIPLDELPVWWVWCFYANPFRYVMEGLWLSSLGCLPDMASTDGCATIFEPSTNTTITTHEYMHQKFSVRARCA